jgi:hypothetical protein
MMKREVICYCAAEIFALYFRFKKRKKIIGWSFRAGDCYLARFLERGGAASANGWPENDRDCRLRRNREYPPSADRMNEFRTRVRPQPSAQAALSDHA